MPTQLPSLPQWSGPDRKGHWRHPFDSGAVWRLAYNQNWVWQRLGRWSITWKNVFAWIGPPVQWVRLPLPVGSTEMWLSFPYPPIVPPQLATPPGGGLAWPF